VTVAERSGKTFYVYPDPIHYQNFVGIRSRYQRYQQLRLANNLARKNLEAAELNQQTDKLGRVGTLGFFNPLYKFVMRRVSRLVLLLILAWFSSGGTAPGEQASTSPAKPNPAPTPIPLTTVPVEALSAMATLQEIDASVSRVQSSAGIIAGSLSNLTSEIDARIAEDMRLLAASPSLDLLYQLKSTWQNFADNLSALASELAQHAASLEEERTRLDQLNKTWQATLQSAKQPDTPQPFLESVQNVVDSVQRTRQAAESGRAQVLTLQGHLSEQEARVRTTLSSVEQSQNRALKSLLVRDSPPIWSGEKSLGREWEKQSRASFSSQLKASTAFIEGHPFSFLLHALLVGLIATALQLMRRRMRKVTEEKPELQRAVPILDLPVSMAFVLSLLIVAPIYPQAPRFIQAIMGTVALIPTVLILRKLLQPNSYPILYALVILFFVGELRLLAAAPLPHSGRLLFLGQMLGGSLFLIWLLRRWHLPTAAAETHGRLWRGIRAIAIIGLIILPAAILANIFGYVHLGNLLGILFLRGVFIAAMLYSTIRILEGLIIIALQIRPLSSLRVVSVHRPMLQRRICRVLEFSAFLFWLSLILNFFGLLTPLTATTKAALNSNLGIGSLNISVHSILAFLIAIWGSFLFSRFLRFLLEEDVYHHFHLAPGIPYATSTMLHYAILLLGLFIALGALGIDLTKITILAGAFSVGIGFGLQNVINNFVSGLILLFERPIKIGDMIEVSGIAGEVRRIGIRASVIRTADGSEVIVPNGSLISSNVTNWTFSDVLRAIEVSVNVVGGADPQRVFELLKSTAAGHPGVAKEPSPQVYVVNFTAGTITFQLRVWTDQYHEWAQLRSDLSVAVNDALAREKIAIA
jgi:potassium-dependent mechanosensitive channel